MTTFRINSKELISKDKNLVKDIYNLIDQYVNVEYDKIYQIMEKTLIYVHNNIFNNMVQSIVDPKLLVILTENWISKLGLNYHTLDTDSLRIFTYEFIRLVFKNYNYIRVEVVSIEILIFIRKLCGWAI